MFITHSATDTESDSELLVPADGPQFSDVVDTATAQRPDFVKATGHVYHSTQASSGIAVGVMPKR